jgi:DNA-binding response OmpR family regulator
MNRTYTDAVPERMILVVEDEAAIAGSVAARLRKEGFAVEIATDGPSAVDRVRDLHPDLVILDVMLPGMDGLEVCREIQRDRPVPVLMLTARDSETDVLVGLGIGADDYMTKPFSPRELVARVKALLRRVERHPTLQSGVLRVGNLQIDPSRRDVRRNGRPIELTRTEFDLLLALALRPGIVLSRERLLADVWGWRDASGARTVDSHIRGLRAKVGPDVIRTVHGVGYALGAEEA